MCGFAGWIDFNIDLDTPDRIAQVRAMTKTLERRGPDASGVWTSSHAILGHQRLSIIDLRGGKQPMTIRVTDKAEVTLVYAGEVYNYKELRKELESLGHVFETSSDTEVVIRSYLEWGEDYVDRLVGMFAFALYDERCSCLIIARDRFGIKPIYYSKQGSTLLFASEPKAILQHSKISASLDTEGFVDLLSLSRVQNRSPFAAIQEVPPAHILVWTRSAQVRLHRYWRLETETHEDTVDETVDRTRDLLRSASIGQLHADVPVCTLLSGGLDSTVLTALAQQTSNGVSARSFSVDFVGQKEQFQSDGFRPDRDQPFVEEAVAAIGCEHETILLDVDEMTSPRARFSVLRALDAPMTFGDVDTSLLLLFEAIRARSTVAISGEGADELFGGYLWFRDPAALASGCFPWLSRMQLLEPKLLDDDFRARVCFDEYRLDSYASARTRIDHLPGDDAETRLMREAIYLHLCHWLPILLERKDRLSMYAGLEVRVPYTDHRLVQYVYNVPWSIKARFGEEKWLLKSAAKDLVPKSILDRKKSPYPTSANKNYEIFLRMKVKKLLANSSDRVFEFISRNALTHELAQPDGYFNTQLKRNNLETAIMLSSWLHDYRVST